MSKRTPHGDPLDEASDIGTIINEKQFNKVRGYVEEGLSSTLPRVVSRVALPYNAPATTAAPQWARQRGGGEERDHAVE